MFRISFLCVIVFVCNSFSLVACSRDNDFAFSDQIHNVLKSVQGMVGNLQDFVGGKQGCAYTCPDGRKSERNVHHVPSSNGCGAFGIQFDSKILVKSVSKCCDEHDICYDTCNNEKNDCDKAFKTCLQLVCKKAKKFISEDLYKGCKSTADVLYAGTVALGCKPYKDAQQKACMCTRTKYDDDL